MNNASWCEFANVTEVEQRTRASQVWKRQVQALVDLGKDEEADGIKAWLRSQYADSIRDRKRGAAPQDFDLIGTEFHRWVRDHEERIGDCVGHRLDEAPAEAVETPRN